MKYLLIAALLVAANTVTPAFAAPKAGKSPAAQAKPALSTLQEAQDASRALRAMEAKMETGLAYADYTRELAELNVNVSALDEVLEDKGADNLRRQLADVMSRYKAAGELWQACVTTRDCRHNFVYIHQENSMAAHWANAVLSEFPEMRQPSDSGGALIRTSDAGEYNMAHYPKLLSVLWADARERGKAFRSALR